MIRWAAPIPAEPVEGFVVVPGSKSATARCFVLAALADGPSLLTGVLEARDTRLMRHALTTLGVTFEDRPDGLLITPPAQFHAGPIDVGLAGTVMRFVPPLAALADGDSMFTGDEEALARPVAPLLDGLRQAGAAISSDSLPFTVHGRGVVQGGSATIDASGSSQFVSGLLMGAARFDEGLHLTHHGGRVPSLPHIGLTMAMLADRGVHVTVDGSVESPTWQVPPGPIAAKNEAVEPDLINAVTFLAAALVTHGRVSVDWPTHTVQAADAIIATIQQLGGVVDIADGRLTVTGIELRGADLDLSDVAELTCIAAALLALSEEGGRIRGVGHVRHHETDRLAALEEELNALGGSVTQTDDGLIIAPAKLSAGTWHTRADHRLAHAGALLGLRVDGIVLDDVGCATKTMSNFPELWADLLNMTGETPV